MRIGDISMTLEKFGNLRNTTESSESQTTFTIIKPTVCSYEEESRNSKETNKDEVTITVTKNLR